MKVGIIGAVGTTQLTLKKLVERGFSVVGVLGHEPKNRLRISGIQDLQQDAVALNVDYKGYQRINDKEMIEWMRKKQPDIIFAVGFSQLLSKEWLTLAPKGCVGFHPTLLPEGRGRAPIAWLILENRNGAATFFQMGEGADDGDIFVQEPFDVTLEDDAESLVPKVRGAIEVALNRWLPDLKAGKWNPLPQDHSKATIYGKRDPADGQIDWFLTARQIDRLIKASCRPHPGAFTSFKSEIVKIWKSEVIEGSKIHGVVGRVLYVDEKGVFIQCGSGLLCIKEYSVKSGLELKVGDSLERMTYTSRKEFNQLILEN